MSVAAPGVADMQSAIEDALNRHNEMLAQHQAALEQLLGQRSVPLDDNEVVWQAMKNTRTMVEDFARCRDAYNDTLARSQARTQPAAPQHNHGNFKARHPAKANDKGDQHIDPSGLFMTDTTPTPIDQLLDEAKQRTTPSGKRRASGEAFRNNVEHNSHKKIRLDRSPQGNGESAQNARPGAQAPRSAPAEPTTVDDEDSFVREVQELHDAKEKKRLKKEEKKRKRDSGASDGRGPPSVSVQLQDMSISNDMQRARKRQKTSNDEVRPKNGGGGAATSRSQSRSPKKRPKPKHSGAKNDKKTKRRRV